MILHFSQSEWGLRKRIILEQKRGLIQRQICKLNKEVSFSILPINVLFKFLSCVIMNTLIWNCRGALSPNFCNNIKDMVRIHSLAIMIIMETKVCGDKARRIVDRLPMDGAIIANSIGLSGGLWLL